MPELDLGNRRILVVEDEPMLAFDITLQIQEHNGVVIGPVATLHEGIRALHRQRPDACILNIRLGAEMVYPLADELLDQRIPFIFASSELRADIPDRFNGVPLHAKPIEMIKAAAGLITHVTTRSGE